MRLVCARARRGSHRSSSSPMALAGLWLVATLLPLLLLPAGVAGARSSVDLEGTWYVLVHYRDVTSANPDAIHWEDRVWVFERRGSRLQWIEYPIVVFADPVGRFEVRAGGSRGRVLAAWEPNRAQLASIERGLEVNTRGSKRKSLRGSQKDGYASRNSMRSLSASSVGYQETWRIGSPASLPNFEHIDVLGSARAETMDGLTRWSTAELLRGGDELRGSYARDEARLGTFRMIRAGEVRGLARDRSQKEIRERVIRRNEDRDSDYEAPGEWLNRRRQGGDAASEADGE